MTFYAGTMSTASSADNRSTHNRSSHDRSSSDRSADNSPPHDPSESGERAQTEPSRATETADTGSADPKAVDTGSASPDLSSAPNDASNDVSNDAGTHDREDDERADKQDDERGSEAEEPFHLLAASVMLHALAATVFTFIFVGIIALLT